MDPADAAHPRPLPPIDAIRSAWPVALVALTVIVGNAIEFDVGERRYGVSTVQLAVAVVAVAAAHRTWRSGRIRIDLVVAPYLLLLAIPLAQALRDGTAPGTAGGLGRFVTVVVLLVALPQFRRNGVGLAGWDLTIVGMGTALAIMALVRIAPAVADPTLGFYEIKDFVKLPLGNHNYVAAMLAMGIAVALARGATTRWALAAVGVMTVGLAVTLSRGGWLALGVVVVTLAVVRRDRRTLMAVGVIAAGAVVVLGLLLVSGNAAERLRGLASPATGPRLDLWRASLDAFGQHPVLGVGINRFPEYMTEVRQAYLHAHNLVLESLAATGIVGTVGYLGYWAAAAWRAATLPSSRLRLALGLPLLSLFVHAQIDSLSYLMVFEVVVATLVGVAATFDTRAVAEFVWRRPAPARARVPSGPRPASPGGPA